MAVPTNTAPFSNLPPNTNVIDADAVNEKFDRLYAYLQSGVEASGIVDKSITPAKIGVLAAARVKLTAPYTPAVTNVQYELPWAAAADFDPAGMWSGSGVSLVAPRTGLYVVTATAHWSTAGEFETVQIYVNNAAGGPECMGWATGPERDDTPPLPPIAFKAQVINHYTAGTKFSVAVLANYAVAPKFIDSADLTAVWLGPLV